FGSEIKLSIKYSGVPFLSPNPPWSGGFVWSHSKSGAPWIGSSLWGGGCDLLWPCVDHPVWRPERIELSVSVPKGLVAPANGVLLGVTEQHDWSIYRWSVKAPQTYGVVLNVGPFKE